MIGATAWMSCGSDETVSPTHTRTLSVPHTPSLSQLLSAVPTRFRALCQSSAALVRVPARGGVDGARGSLVDIERRLVFRVFGMLIVLQCCLLVTNPHVCCSMSRR